MLIVLIGCTSINNNNKIQLRYICNVPVYYDYNLLEFIDNKDSSIYIISYNDTNTITKSSNMDSLIEGNYYELELIAVPKGLYMKSIIRGSWPFSFRDNNGCYITHNDTLVGTVYQSPDIIEKFYIKR